MAERITQKQIEWLCKEINMECGHSVEPWTTQEDGTLKANVGTYYISYAYGGVSLCQMSNPLGAARDIVSWGHLTKRDLWLRMWSYLEGIRLGKSLK